MFAAVGLFVLLLLAMLYIAFVRFRNPPLPPGQAPTVGIVTPAPRSDLMPGATANALGDHLALRLDRNDRLTVHG